MFNRKRYMNIDPAAVTNSFKDLRQWQKERKAKVKDFSYTVEQSPAKVPDYLRSNREEVSITWIGHSTFYLQVGGLNIWTDPVFANRMGFAKRLAGPGYLPEELPNADVVLISHGHYDHLDYPSLRRLQGDPLFLVPVGLGAAFRRKGYRAEEFGWWQECELQGVKLTFVPAQHWVRRGPFDMNTSLWGGWMIEGAGGSVYFAGDSGYFQGFKEIGDRFDIDYALMPIGAYEPEWFMRMQHVSPEEAVQAHLDVKAKYMVPMHYGAYALADDTPREALDRVLAEWERLGLEKDTLKVMKLGETLK